MSPTRITDIAFRAPAPVDMTMFAELLADEEGGDAVGRVIGNAAIRSKGMAVDPTVEDPRGWTTARRMERSLTEARVLGREAIAEALRRAGLTAVEIGMLATNTTTTHAAPGLETLAHDMGMSDDVDLLSMGPMGCYGALPALSATYDWVLAHRQPAVLLCVDLFSPHLQPGPYETEEAVVLTLFGDGAAAVVIRPSNHLGDGGSNGLSLVDHQLLTVPSYAEDLSVALGDSGLRIRLRPTIPDAVASAVTTPVDRLLRRNGLSRDDVRWWALHPGGRRVIDRVVDVLGIDGFSEDVSRAVMRDYGNTAAPAVLAVLEQLQQTKPLNDGDYGMALAFGPGATIWTVLLRGC